MPKTVHQTYLCPNCLKPAKKDMPLNVLLANLQSPESLNFADAKTLPAPLRRLRQCEECKGTLDLPALVQGSLDYHGWGVRLGALAGAGCFAALLGLTPPLELHWVGLAAALAALVTWFAVDTAERARIARFRKTID
jgi:hypothetical protein